MKKEIKIGVSNNHNDIFITRFYYQEDTAEPSAFKSVIMCEKENWDFNMDHLSEEEFRKLSSSETPPSAKRRILLNYLDEDVIYGKIKIN